MEALIPHPIGLWHREGRVSGTFEAASLFVDISGFTALTETLMQHQKDGAEALTDALHVVFRPLVEAVYHYGGFITTFAGDAFTALFPIGAEVGAAQATQCALWAGAFVQQFFVRHGKIATRYGHFSLNVKVGVGLGTVEWGILGLKPHANAPAEASRGLTYFFRGAAVDACAMAEHDAERGDIVITDQVRAMVANTDNVTTGPVGQHFKIEALSREPPPGLSAQVWPRRTVAPREVAGFVLDSVLDLMHSGARAEFRDVAVAFLSFAHIAEQHQLDHFAATVLELTGAYGGYFNKLDFGDKGGVMLVLFGAPVGYENNLERAADFLLMLRAWAPEVPWRGGLTVGTVYAGFMGGDERCEYTAIGDVVNLAARLMMQAAWGEIWTSAPVAGYLRARRYKLEDLGTFQFKGKSGAIASARLDDRPSAGEAHLHHGPMVGREEAMLRLVEWLHPIFQYTFAGVITVYGEGGLGKSRLAYEVHQRLQEMFRVRWLVCSTDDVLRQSLNPFRYVLYHYFDQHADHEVEENKARFEAVLEALKAAVELKPSMMANALVHEIDRTRSFLGALVGLYWEGSLYEQLEPKLRFENTLLAVKTLFQAECLCQPVVVQLEGLQWLDDDSMEVLAVLSRAMHGYPFAIVATSRYQQGSDQIALPLDERVPHPVLELKPFSSEEIASYAAKVLSGPVCDDLVHFLSERTSGNPFFIEQLLLDLRERQVIATVGDCPDGEEARPVWGFVAGQATTDVPTSISAVLVARLDRLTVPLKHVVQAASVIGREFAVQVLQHILHDDSSVFARVRNVERERVWSQVGDLRYVFRQSLLHNAAYEMQLRARLRELHELVGAAIEQIYAADLAPYYADLAYHYGKAENWPREGYYARLAGLWATERFANSEAIQYLSRALDLTEETAYAERYELLLAREQVYDLRGARDEQSRDLTELAALAAQLDDTARQAEAALRMANYAIATDRYKVAIAAAKQAITLAHRQSEPPERNGDSSWHEALGYVRWGMALRLQGAYQESQQQLEHALTLAREREHAQIEAECLRQLASVAYYLGNEDQAWVFDEQALHIFRGLNDLQGEARTLESLGSDAGEDYETAIAYYQQALNLYRQIGYQWGEGITLGNLGQLYREQGHFAQASKLYDQGLAICQAIADQSGVSWFFGNRGWMCLYQGDYGPAEAAFQEALGICQRIGALPEEGWVLTGLALLAALREQYDAAGTYGRQALQIAQESGARLSEADASYVMGRALHGQGNLNAAAQAYAQALGIWQELGQNTRAMEARAGLARVCLAQERETEARAHVEAIGQLLAYESLVAADEPFLVYLTCYQVLQGGEPAQARAVLAQAGSELQDWAARIPDERLRRSFCAQVPYHRELLALWDREFGTA
jgi:class 3 adenylate cyclase/tetratricopeptide (TPR) repeat protein